MSFMSVLKTIGHDFGIGVAVATKLEPVIGEIPVVGAPINLVLNAITAVEQLVPTAGAGAAKKSAVTTLVNASTTIDPAVLSAVIDDVVSALNALAAAGAKLPATASPGGKTS